MRMNGMSVGMAVSGVYGRGGGAPSLPLDSLTAGAAYSVRRLRTAYTGPLMRVRRSSDNTEQDIGYGGDGWLDETALLSFVGAGSGYVKTWYDQSGNSRDVSQATTANQPRIVNAGVLEEVGSHPTPYFTGTTMLVGTSPFAFAAGEATFCIVAAAAAANNRAFYLERSTAGSASYLIRTGTAGLPADLYRFQANDAAATNVVSLYTAALDSNLKILSVRDSGAQIEGYVNGALGSQPTYSRSGVYTFNEARIGGGSSGTGITGAMPEIIVFPENLTNTQFNSIGGSQASAWGVTFSPVYTPVEALSLINGAPDNGGSFAVGLAGVHDYTDPIFVDRAKQARGWYRSGDFVPVPEEHLNSEGALISLPDGDTSSKFFFCSATTDGRIGAVDRGGRFRATWTGTATVDASSAGSNITVTDSNSLEFDCDWDGNKWLNVSWISGAVKVAIIRTDLLAMHASGSIFDPAYIEFLPEGGCFRFMDWMGTNSSTVTEWVDYPAVESQIWDRIPVAAMVTLCNLKQSDPWFCMPHQCSADFAEQMAEYVHANLDDTLSVRVEKSNEIWNTGLFTQGAYFKSLAESDWGVEDGYVGSAWLQYAGKMFVRDIQAWLGAFADSPTRVIGVIAGQAANASVVEFMASATMWQTYEPEDYVKPSSLAKEVAIAPYLNWGGTQVSDGNAIKAALDISHEDAVSYLKGLFNPSLERSKAWIDNHVPVAVSHDCRLVMYEYNNHFDLNACSGSDLYSGGSPVAGALDVFVEATYSEEMADSQDALRLYWKESAGSLSAFFVDMVPYSRFGTWGAATHINHDSAIWNALKAWHTANPRWWSQ